MPRWMFNVHSHSVNMYLPFDRCSCFAARHSKVTLRDECKTLSSGRRTGYAARAWTMTDQTRCGPKPQVSHIHSPPPPPQQQQQQQQIRNKTTRYVVRHIPLINGLAMFTTQTSPKECANKFKNCCVAPPHRDGNLTQPTSLRLIYTSPWSFLLLPVQLTTCTLPYGKLWRGRMPVQHRSCPNNFDSRSVTTSKYLS